MSDDERAMYVKQVEEMDNENLEYETDDTFLGMFSNSDEEERYLICQGEKKRREGI